MIRAVGAGSSWRTPTVYADAGPPDGAPRFATVSRAPRGAPATPATDCRSARAGARSDGARGVWRTGGRAGTIAGAPCATAPARGCERSARTGCSRRTASLRRTVNISSSQSYTSSRPFSRSRSGMMTRFQKAPVARTGLERGMVERDERPLAWPACHLRLSLFGDRLVPNHTGHAADDGRIWIVPPSFSSPAAAQNLGVLRATRPVDHAVPDGFRSLRVPADVHLVLVPEPDGRPHIQPALESTHERQRRTVERVDLTGVAQRVPDEFFVGLLVRRIRVPMERFPGPRVRQLLVVGIPRLARQLRHVGRIENRPGHREPRLGRQSPAAEAEAGLDLIRAPRVRVDLEGQRVERLGRAWTHVRLWPVRTAAPHSGARWWRWPPARARPAAAAR